MMNKWLYYVLALAGFAALSYGGNLVKKSINRGATADEYELVKQYLLNDSPLYGHNRPKIWVHSSYELNARQWKSFRSRNSTNLNQPYLYLTIQSIINHCGNDFHVCLVDDQSFGKLLPGWDTDLAVQADPLKAQIREIGLLQLVYFYGGVVVPNSFLCTQSLLPLYLDSVAADKPFVCEQVNRFQDTLQSGRQRKCASLFAPALDVFGAAKNHAVLKEWAGLLKLKLSAGHVSGQAAFQGEGNHLCADYAGRITVVDGHAVGCKSKQQRRPLLLEDWLQEGFLDVDPDDMYGVLIPRDELLRRNKYQWFAVLPPEQVLAGRTILSKFFQMSEVASAKNDRTVSASVAEL